jgi:two-component system, OmpR family, response regulator CpxR
LEAEGFEVDAVHRGEQGIERALSGEYALVVLDVMLPGLNGFDVLRRISAGARLPVLMLSARGEDVDRIVGLQIGADDYLPKPFNPHELVARIRAILRRTYPEGHVQGKVPMHERIAVGEVELDKNSWKVRRSGETVELTALEFNLLEVFLKAVGRVLTREELARTVLDREFGPFDRSIDMHVSNLRKKLGRQPDGSERIKSVRGVGYVYTSPSVSTDSPG